MLSRYYITISILQYKKSCSAALVPSNDIKVIVTELCYCVTSFKIESQEQAVLQFAELYDDGTIN
jgi:hypothetical protein